MLTRRNFLKGLAAAAVAVGFSPLKPFVIQEPFYVGFISDPIYEQLKSIPDEFRGKRNPLFTGQLGIYNGVTLHARKD